MTAAYAQMSARRRASVAGRPLAGAALVTLALAAVYASTASRYLEEWDSIQFALGLEQFDIIRHQPHPPGYPAYIGAGKVLMGLAGDATTALVLLSVITGAATAGLVFVLLRRDFSPFLALAGTLTMALAPMTWMSAGKAMTDTPGLFLLVAFLVAIAAPPGSGRGDTMNFRLIAPALVGLTLGVRPHYALIMLVIMVIARRRGVWPSGRLALEMLVLVAATSVWLVPAALATGGFGVFWQETLGQFLGRFGHSRVSVLAVPVTGLPDAETFFTLVRYALIERPQEFAKVIARHYGIATPHLQGPTFVLDIAMLVGIAAAVARWYPRRHVARLYLPALGVYLVAVFLVLPPWNPRYELPLVMLFAWFVPALGARLLKQRVRAAVVIGIVVLVGGMGTGLAIRRALSVPPPVTAAHFVAAQPEAMLIAAGIERHVRYYEPQVKLIRWQSGEDFCGTAFAAIRRYGTVLSDVYSLCGIEGDLILEVRRDRRMHEKHWHTGIYRYSDAQLPD